VTNVGIALGKIHILEASPVRQDVNSGVWQVAPRGPKNAEKIVPEQGRLTSRKADLTRIPVNQWYCGEYVIHDPMIIDILGRL
jgi:hypothetical protein